MDIVFIIIYMLGWVAIICGIVFLYTKYKEKHHIPELVENLLGLVLLVSFAFAGLTLMNSYKQKVEHDLKQTQMMYCLGTKHSNGTQLTESQCEYFQDVLNGKYYGN